MNIHPVQAECDDKRPDCAKQANVEASNGRRAKYCMKEEVTEHNDEECCKAIYLMRNIHGSAEFDLEQFLRPWGIAEEPDQLFDDDGDPCHSNLAAKVQVSHEERNEQQKGDTAQNDPKSLLASVMIAGERVDQMRDKTSDTRCHV